MLLYEIRKRDTLVFLLLCVSFFQCKESTKQKTKEDQVITSLGETLYKTADSLYYSSSFDDAIASYALASEAFDEVLDTSGVAKSLNDIGLCYYRKGLMDSARVYYGKAIHLDSIQRDTSRLIGRLRNIGLTYYQEGNYINSIPYYKNSLELAKQIHKEKSIAAIYNSLGNMYQEQDRFSLAKENFEQSLRIYKRLNRRDKEALLYNNLGVVEAKLGENDNALRFHLLALKMKKELGNNQSKIAFSFHNIGVLYRQNKNYTLSEDYLKKAYRIRQDLNELRNLAITSNALADLYLTQQQTSLALPYLREAEAFVSEHIDYKVKRNNLEKWAKYYNQRSEYQKAYKLLKEWSVLNDSLFNAEKLEVLQTWNQFELQQEEKATEEQRTRAEKFETTAKDRLIILFGLTGILTLIVIFTWILHRQRKKILVLNRNLDLLNTDIRHRKSNDYQRILTELKKLDIEAVSSLENMLFSSVALDDALYEGSGEEVNLKLHFHKIIKEKQNRLLFEEKGVRIQHAIVAEKVKRNVASKLTFIVSELITNSIKHSLMPSRKLEISLEIQKVDADLVVVYSENGRTISKEQLESSTGLGWKMIRGFAAQLSTTIHIAEEGGLNIFKMVINPKLLKNE